MVSEAVQTSFQKRADCPRHGTAIKHHPAGAFTPETSDLSAENLAPSRRNDLVESRRNGKTVTGDVSKAKAGQCKCHNHSIMTSWEGG